VDDLTGAWWHPDEPAARVPGQLVREGDRWELRLLGSLSDRHDRRVADVLHGTHGGQPVSLLDCSRVRARYDGRATLDESWVVRTAIRGATIDGWDDPAFTLADAEMDDLAEFMDLRLVTHARDLAGPDAEDVIVVARPPEIAATTPDGTYALFSGGTTRTGVRDYRHDYRASLHVQLRSPVSLSDIHRHHLRPMTHLLALATGDGIELRGLKLGRPDPEVPLSDFARWQVLDADHDTVSARRGTIAHNMLFTCTDWDFARGYPVWSQIVSRYGPTCDLLFSRTAPGQQYLSTLFLNSVTAAESFHRRWKPGTGRATPEHKARIKALVAAVPQDDQQWLRERLAHSHEPTLARRLAELVAYAGTSALPYVGEPTAWSRKVAAARNDLIHRSPRRDDPEDTDPEGLLALEQSVAAVTTACLLRELGFAADDAAQRMSRGFVWNSAQRAMRSRHPTLFEDN
jgi:hypothetical protein